MADTNETGPVAPVGRAETALDNDAESVVTARDRFQRLSQEVQTRYQQVSEEVRRGAERVSEDVRRGAERASEEIRRGSDVARERYGDVAQNARLGYDKVLTKSGDLSRDLAIHVRDNPARSVLVAAGVGFLVGLLFRRGRRDDDLL